MSQNEYEAFTIDEIMEMISSDSIDSMSDQAQGWANAAAVLQAEQDNLTEQYGKAMESWTSQSAAPFKVQVQLVMQAISQAKVHAERKSAAWANIAGRAKQTYENVGTKYQEWQTVKNTPDESSPLKLLFGDLSELNPDASVDENLQTQKRLEFDQAARNYMNLLAEYAEEEALDIKMPLPEYTPPVDPTRPDPSELQDPGAVSPTTVGAAISTTAAGPALQSGVPGSATAPPVLPSTSGAPPTYTPSMPTGGSPIGGLSPVGRTPTPPALKAPAPISAKPATTPVRTPTARTPGLPTNRAPVTSRPNLPTPRSATLGNNPQGQPGVSSPNRPTNSPAGRGTSPQRGTGQPAGRGTTSSQGRNTARNGNPPGKGTPGRTERLQRSQMAPVDRRSSVRGSGQVLGQRPAGATKESKSSANKPAPRRVQPPVIGNRAGTGSRAKLGGLTRRQPTDLTGKGYTTSVIGKKTKRGNAEDEDKFTRTPVVATTIATAGVVIGSRAVASAEADSQRRLRIRQERRKKLRSGGNEPTRAVIGNGVQRPDELDSAIPTGEQPVKTPTSFWETDAVVPGVIGARRPRPEVQHDPGPTKLADTPSAPPPATSHSAGPVAFKDRDQQPGTGWLT